MQYFVNIT